MTSRWLSTISAVLLGAAGVVLLFAADSVVPRLVPGYPENQTGAWLGQLLGAAWLGLAWLNWLSRGVIVGGIYGRPILLPNVAVYFISSLVLLKALPGIPEKLPLVLLLVPAVVLACAYGWLMYRGPFRRDMPKA